MAAGPLGLKKNVPSGTFLTALDEFVCSYRVSPACLINILEFLDFDDEGNNRNLHIPEEETKGNPLFKQVWPAEGFCIKTLNGEGGLVFINICHCDDIKCPSNALLDRFLNMTTDELQTVDLPVSLGKPHRERDEGGHVCLAFDIILNTDFYEKQVVRNDLLKAYVLVMIMRGLNEKYHLDLQMTIVAQLTERKYWGKMPQHFIDRKKPAFYEDQEFARIFYAARAKRTLRCAKKFAVKRLRKQPAKSSNCFQIRPIHPPRSRTTPCRECIRRNQVNPEVIEEDSEDDEGSEEEVEEGSEESSEEEEGGSMEEGGSEEEDGSAEESSDEYDDSEEEEGCEVEKSSDVQEASEEDDGSEEEEGFEEEEGSEGEEDFEEEEGSEREEDFEEEEGSEREEDFEEEEGSEREEDFEEEEGSEREEDFEEEEWSAEQGFEEETGSEEEDSSEEDEGSEEEGFEDGCYEEAEGSSGEDIEVDSLEKVDESFEEERSSVEEDSGEEGDVEEGSDEEKYSEDEEDSEESESSEEDSEEEEENVEDEDPEKEEDSEERMNLEKEIERDLQEEVENILMKGVDKVLIKKELKEEVEKEIREEVEKYLKEEVKKYFKKEVVKDSYPEVVEDPYKKEKKDHGMKKFDPTEAEVPPFDSIIEPLSPTPGLEASVSMQADFPIMRDENPEPPLVVEYVDFKNGIYRIGFIIEDENSSSPSVVSPGDWRESVLLLNSIVPKKNILNLDYELFEVLKDEQLHYLALLDLPPGTKVEGMCVFASADGVVLCNENGMRFCEMPLEYTIIPTEIKIMVERLKVTMAIPFTEEAMRCRMAEEEVPDIIDFYDYLRFGSR